MGPEVIIVPVIFLPFFALLFGVFYFRNKENMALIDRGLNPRVAKALPRPFTSLKYGLLLCGSGLGFFIAFLIDRLAINHTVMGSEGPHQQEFPQIYFALIALFGGLGLILSYRIEKKEWLDRKDTTAIELS